MEEQEQADIKARIAELRKAYEILSSRCKGSWVTLSPSTTEAYAKEIESLETQLKNKIKPAPKGATIGGQ